MAVLTREVLLRRLFRYLAKRADEGLFGQVSIDFQDGFPTMVRTIRQAKLQHEHEVDGVTEDRLSAILGGD